MKTKSKQQHIIWVFLLKDSEFMRRDEAACGRLTARAIAALQSKAPSTCLVAETKDLTRAVASFKLLRLPNSRSYFLRKEVVRHYEKPAATSQLSLV